MLGWLRSARSRQRRNEAPRDGDGATREEAAGNAACGGAGAPDEGGVTLGSALGTAGAAGGRTGGKGIAEFDGARELGGIAGGD